MLAPEAFAVALLGLIEAVSIVVWLRQNSVRELMPTRNLLVKDYQTYLVVFCPIIQVQFFRPFWHQLLSGC